jgi:hypothetical protein
MLLLSARRLRRKRLSWVRFCAIVAVLASSLASRAHAAPVVWAIDDGEKIRRDAIDSPLARGTNNPIWSPGAAIRMFAAKNETVALQIVISTDDALDGVTVDLDELRVGSMGRSPSAPAPARIANAEGASDPTRYVGRNIERFVEHFVDVRRPSGGRVKGESLGWAAGSGPAPSAWVGEVPDALIPVEVAPPWAPYPMTIAAHTNGIVWIDVTVPRAQPAAVYEGTVVVKAGGAPIATLPIVLEVADVVLPDRPVRTMVYYDRLELDRRMGGGDAAEEQLWRLFHRHRLSPLHGAMSADETRRKLGVLDGSFYDAAHGYEGPGEHLGDGILSIGTYGILRAPSVEKLATVEAIADVMAEHSLFETTDTFVYAIDEVCKSPYAAEWKKLIAGSANANVKRVRVGATCSEDPTLHAADIVMVHDSFDPERTSAARAIGKEVWVYNGRMPFTGSFLTDTSAIGPRVDGWLGAMFDVGRWFFWETTFWYDDNRGGKGAYDPFVTAETFHNQDDDYVMGDGVLVYPGKQIDAFVEHSIGMDGVVASIRMKNWRRGIEDAGYYQLAHAAAPAQAEAIAHALLPRVFSAAIAGTPAAWSNSGKPHFEARKALLALVPRGTDGGRGAGAMPSHGTIAPGARTTFPAGTTRAPIATPVRSRTIVLAGIALLLALAGLVKRLRAKRPLA